MSAICGLYHFNQNPIHPVLLDKMMASLSHRGSDDAGVWYEQQLGLGHQMRWTTPESLLEKLPLISSSGNAVITADARIDNREELISALALRGIADKITDSQIILAAYEKWQEQCPEHLLGDFAFAIWDKRQQKLFCARDPFGIKPFYYHHRAGRFFACATEIKAILSLPEVPNCPNQLRIAYYLAAIIPDQTITFYQDIYRLPPAHSLTVTDSDFRLNCYWELDPQREVRYASDQEYALAFREIFTEAVRCRLRSAFPIGFTLSGGLDSSSVACTARSLLAEPGKLPIHTFSMVYDAASECDERPYIQSVVEQGNIDPCLIRADDWGVFHQLQQSLQQQDQPLEIRNQFMWQAMYSAAQQRGIRVMLDGEDGDTVVSYGQGYLAELAIARQWERFSQEAKGLAQHFNHHNTSANFYLKTYGFPYLSELAQTGRWLAFAQSVEQIATHFNLARTSLWLNQGLKPLLPDRLRQAYRMRRGLSVPQAANPLLQPEFAKQVDLVGNAERLQQRYEILIRSHREGHWLGLTAHGTSWIEEESDRAAAAFGIEKRHPFWDRRLVEFCLALPAEQLLQRGWTRSILRQAMTGILPEKIQWRVGKSNLGANFVHSLSTLERDLLAQTIVEQPQNIGAYVDIVHLQETYQRFLAKPTVSGAEMMWKVVNLALWLNRFSSAELSTTGTPCQKQSC